MEERKIASKEVKMNLASKGAKREGKLSYEDLNKVCAELSQRNQYLMQQLQQANLANMYKRLDYLFMVLQHAEVIKDADFINACVDEIKSAITIEEQEEVKKEE